jgi:hypothetical protein
MTETCRLGRGVTRESARLLQSSSLRRDTTSSWSAPPPPPLHLSHCRKRVDGLELSAPPTLRQPCRTAEKASAAVEQITSAARAALPPGGRLGEVSGAVCDLASLASVRAFASEYRASGRPLDILMLNAGLSLNAQGPLPPPPLRRRAPEDSTLRGCRGSMQVHALRGRARRRGGPRREAAGAAHGGRVRAHGRGQPSRCGARPPPSGEKGVGRGARERWPLRAQVTSSSRTCWSRCLSSRRTPRPASSSLPQGSRPRPATPAPNCQGLQGPPVQTADFDASAPMHPRPAPRARPTAARCGARCTTPRRRAAASARSLRSATSAASRRALGGTWSTVRPARPTTFKSNHFAI